MSLQNVVLNSLESMSQARKVDLGILRDFDDLAAEMNSCSEKWLKEGTLLREDAFLVYHSIRNMSMIIDKAKQRFVYAAEKGENPSVVSDGLMVFPYLVDLYDMLCSLKGRTFSSEIRRAIWRRLRLLRDISRRAAMLPSTSEEVKGLDVELVKKELSSFASALQAIASEGQSPT
jgi:hypothetical protein